MIALSKLNQEELWLNPLQIELITANPDCVITLSNGHKYVVRESPQEVTRRVKSFLEGLSLRIVCACGEPGQGEPDEVESFNDRR